MDNISESHVEVKDSKTAGNGLFATKDIGAGELVLMIKRPLVGVLDIPRLKDTCSNCFMWSVGSVEEGLTVDKPTINACAGCKQVNYCSKGSAYPGETAVIVFSKPGPCSYLPPLPSAVRAGRELGVLMNSDKTSEETKQGIRRMQKHTMSTILAGHTQDAADRMVAEAFGASAEALRDIRRREHPDSNEEHGSSLEYVGQIYRNSLTLVTPLYDPLGLAFDPLLCTANHSCNPNTTVVMDGPLISLRSLEPIKKGAEVFISYIDHTNPFTVRQAELKDRYCFTCECPKCLLRSTQREDEWLRPADQLAPQFDLLDGIPYGETEFAKNPAYHIGPTPSERRLAALQGQVFTQHAQSKTLSTPTSTITKCETTMQLCAQSKMFAQTRQPYPTLRTDLTASLLTTNQPLKALFHMSKTHFSIDPILYPQPFHPVRVVHTWGLVKVLLWLYSSPHHPGTRKLVDDGFDFVVVIWRLLRLLGGVVGRSHGPGRFAMLVLRTVEEVRRGIGEQLGVIERDPLGQWAVFEVWKDVPEF